MSAARIRATALPSLTDALRAVESVLLRGGRRTARRNAWSCVVQDRRRARDRREAQQLMERFASAAER
ncbi:MULTISPECIES: hypothetical protein [Streptomyces]|jgi:hypothetical protein|uniref:Uncharacterized protein n=1 Tax=Streptomyces thermoviolaceus subsp. thermoviolaceus TaxID=66860 RepID=A0ABX0YS47_STRTL|nr:MULTISPECIES: hypothetical protein [Streptomyces]MCM3264357.1 hypothetical protein [Streptomyces thermoviolaceus]NJP13883.1 hypothetical protein [Streptomyces thermoviolaceus subsp. thermoviolaceus]RSS08337.1 hypothetical protein EF917_02085 [Streptomyces sp. WAC00469]WTD49502.1 hypothetical protein OG899_19510 [Streptomyces thermoviolaceus]GGV61500.1 hypothetical protein GCM10010499_03060 [Streptomyces thermoviolaceus subsp. apingens]